jgi:hypothetical protein
MRRAKRCEKERFVSFFVFVKSLGRFFFADGEVLLSQNGEDKGKNTEKGRRRAART